MIISKINGGLGNQMFQYAAGKAIAKKNSVSLGVDISFFENIAPGDTLREFELNLFNTTAEVVHPPKISFFKKGARINSVLRKAWEKKYTPVKEKKDFTFDPEMLSRNLQNCILSGYWQSFRYFEHLHSELVHDFTPASEPNEFNRALIQQLGSEPFISLHVRRGDYILNPNAAKFHGSCDLAYYREAIKLLSDSSEYRSALVFSDDPEWCKANLEMPWETQFVHHNAGKNAYWDIYLMSLCRAHVIANSSFSWWGAWLAGDRSEKIIAPKRWTLALDSSYSDLLPENWIKI